MIEQVLVVIGIACLVYNESSKSDDVSKIFVSQPISKLDQNFDQAQFLRLALKSMLTFVIKFEVDIEI